MAEQKLTSIEIGRAALRIAVTETAQRSSA